MVDISKIKEWINVGDIKEKMLISKENLPKHVAITAETAAMAPELWQERMETILQIMKAATTLNIPILTFLLLKEKQADEKVIEQMTLFFRELSKSELVAKNQVKVSIIGKWYDLPGSLIEEIKKVIDRTKDYDKFFLNFCINYDGQEEIMDALKLIGMQIRVGKVDPSAITRELVKDSLYSSTFLPPDLIINIGTKLHGILLWDSASAAVYLAEMPWTSFTKSDFLKAVQYYQAHK